MLSDSSCSFDAEVSAADVDSVLLVDVEATMVLVVWFKRAFA